MNSNPENPQQPNIDNSVAEASAPPDGAAASDGSPTGDYEPIEVAGMSDVILGSASGVETVRFRAEESSKPPSENDVPAADN